MSLGGLAWIVEAKVNRQEGKAAVYLSRSVEGSWVEEVVREQMVLGRLRGLLVALGDALRRLVLRGHRS